MAKAVVFKKLSNDPIVIVGELRDSQITSYTRAGWVMEKANVNKYGIPIAPITHKYKHAEDVELGEVRKGSRILEKYNRTRGSLVQMLGRYFASNR